MERINHQLVLLNEKFSLINKNLEEKNEILRQIEDRLDKIYGGMI